MTLQRSKWRVHVLMTLKIKIRLTGANILTPIPSLKKKLKSTAISVLILVYEIQKTYKKCTNVLEWEIKINVWHL